MNTVRIALVLCLSLTGCLVVDDGSSSLDETGTTTAAIKNGDPDLEYSAVCSMSVPRPNSDNGMPQDNRRCSCALVGAQTVLTSASCLFEYQDSMLPGAIVVTFGSSVGAGSAFNVTEIEFHRYYSNETPSANDLAFVRLDGAPAGDPLAINTTALGSADEGMEITLVGFGEQNNDADDFGTRRKITVPMRSVNANSLFAGTADATTCDGDGGGPGLRLGGAEPLLLTVTTRQSQCFENVVRTRVDRFASTFVLPYIDRFDGACILDGTCTTTGCRTPDPDCDPCAWNGVCEENCPTRDWDCELGAVAGEPCTQSGECEQGGTCVTAVDEPAFTYCTKACDLSIGDDCPQGMICDDQDGSGECVFDPTMPTPGSQGYRCSFGSQCRSGICEELICVNECDPNAPMCAEGYTCGPSAVESGKNVCLGRQFTGGGGFCTAGPAGTSEQNGGRPFGLAILISAGFALFVVRRRRA